MCWTGSEDCSRNGFWLPVVAKESGTTGQVLRRGLLEYMVRACACACVCGGDAVPLEENRDGRQVDVGSRLL